MTALTIITIHLNDFDGLERTSRSLQGIQEEEGVKWIVIDGESDRSETDPAVLERLQSLADRFISEPDEGIYDAMNKGANEAGGEYVLFLNAGDELHPEFQLGKLPRISGTDAPVMVWGHCLVQYHDGSTVRIRARSPSWTWYGMPACHPSIFFRRDALGTKPYDTRYRIGADFDLVCRLVCSGEQIDLLDTDVSIFHRGGLSDVSGQAAFEEENDIRRRHYPLSPILAWCIMKFRGLSSRLSTSARLRRLWRR